MKSNAALTALVRQIVAAQVRASRVVALRRSGL